MTRKLSSTFIIILLISLFVATPVQAAKSYYAEYFNVQIDLEEGGSAIITETVKFHFEGDPFTFAFREISATETDGVTFLAASMDGVPMSKGTQAGQVEVDEGNPLKVTWHFSPTSDAAHIFVVRYRVDGVIRTPALVRLKPHGAREGDGDRFIWRAVPEDHDYAIERSTITLTYPSKATVLGQPTLDWNFAAAWEDGRLILTANGIAADEDLILTARFAPNSLTDVAPRWQTQKEQADAARARALPIGFIAGIATLILGGLGLLTYIRANGRELNISPVVSTANPPSDLSPAIVGKLTKQQHTFMGTVFDLAQRGVLEVREEKGFWGGKSYVLTLKNQSVFLQPHEQGLLAALFKPGESQIKMSEVANRLAMKSKLYDEPLEQELIQRGWLDPERKQKRLWLAVGGLVMMILSLTVFILRAAGGGVSLSENSNWLPVIAGVAGISAGLFILSIPFLVYGAMYSILTPAGEEQSARWKGFAEYLRQVSKGKEPAIRPDYFEKNLAYAAVFGLGANWAKYFQKLGGVQLPVWFHATAGSGGDFGAMVALMAASDSTGASAGGDGGAGASGGGSSGAG